LPLRFIAASVSISSNHFKVADTWHSARVLRRYAPRQVPVMRPLVIPFLHIEVPSERTGHLLQHLPKIVQGDGRDVARSAVGERPLLVECSKPLG
jgi:hypothetical protein